VWRGAARCLRWLLSPPAMLCVSLITRTCIFYFPTVTFDTGELRCVTVTHRLPARGTTNSTETYSFFCYKKLWTKTEKRTGGAGGGGRGSSSSHYSEIWWNWIYCQMSCDAEPPGLLPDIILCSALRILGSARVLKGLSYRVQDFHKCCARY
jgi:hypothetical protein